MYKELELHLIDQLWEFLMIWIFLDFREPVAKSTTQDYMAKNVSTEKNKLFLNLNDSVETSRKESLLWFQQNLKEINQLSRKFKRKL